MSALCRSVGLYTRVSWHDAAAAAADDDDDSDDGDNDGNDHRPVLY